MKDFWEQLLRSLFSLRGKRLGILIGTVFGFLFLFIGFIKVLIFAGFVALGFYVGSMWENNEDWRDVVDRILPPKS